MDLSVVVPVYNSAQTLASLVDDGSFDGSWALIQGLAARQDWVRGVRLDRRVLTPP